MGVNNFAAGEPSGKLRLQVRGDQILFRFFARVDVETWPNFHNHGNLKRAATACRIEGCINLRLDDVFARRDLSNCSDDRRRKDRKNAYETFRAGLEHVDPGISANVIIGLIKVTSFLLDRQIRQLEQDFVRDGGLRERMTRARLEYRSNEKYRKSHGGSESH